VGTADDDALAGADAIGVLETLAGATGFESGADRGWHAASAEIIPKSARAPIERGMQRRLIG
jgi:hypothetical protein